MAGLPKYPKDMGTEWMQLKRDVKSAFTSANSRVPYGKIGAGVLRVLSSLTIEAGAFIKFVYQSGITGMIVGRHTGGGDPVDGMFIKRADGTIAFWMYSRVSDGYGYTAIYDQQGNAVVSDDGNTQQGLATPWITVPYVETAELTAPPANRSTTNTTDTVVINTYHPMQHPKLQFAVYVHNAGGGTCEFKFKNPATGVTLFSTTSTGGYVVGSFAISPWVYMDYLQLDLSIRRSAGAGAVGITLISLMGRQS